MGRRYDSASYARVVERLRATVPGVAVHGDVIVGFPTEDEAAWDRSFAFIVSLGLSGIHAFRYSARPGTPATRMAGQVDEGTKKRRAAQLLALAAEGRAARAASRVGSAAEVLFETRLEDGCWVGHAEDYVLVAAPESGGRPLENVIARVAILGVDPAVADRTNGRVIDRDSAHA